MSKNGLGEVPPQDHEVLTLKKSKPKHNTESKVVRSTATTKQKRTEYHQFKAAEKGPGETKVAHASSSTKQLLTGLSQQFGSDKKIVENVRGGITTTDLQNWRKTGYVLNPSDKKKIQKANAALAKAKKGK